MSATIISASRRADGDADCFAEVPDPAGGSATLATYTYDGFGRRIKKVAGEGTTLFFYDTEGHLILEVDKRPTADASRTYVYLEDELVGLVERQKEVGVTAWLPPPVAGPIEIDPRLALWLVVGAAGLGVGLATRRASPGLETAGSGAALFLLCAGASPTPRITWVHVDPLGTPLAVTSAPATYTPAAAIWRATHEPFGKATVDEDPDGDSNAFALPIRFAGQYADAETGWHSNFYRTYDPATGRFLEAERVQPSRQDRALDGIEEIQGQRFGRDILVAFLPHFPQHAGAVDPATGRLTELGSSSVANGRWSQYAYAGNEPISWIDPLGDSKTKGIQTGADSYLHRFRAAQGNRDALCAIDDEVEQLWKLRDASMPKARYRKVKAWFKLAKKNQLRALVPPVCVATSLCACAEQPESCAAMFEDQ